MNFFWRVGGGGGGGGDIAHDFTLGIKFYKEYTTKKCESFPSECFKGGSYNFLVTR